MYTISKAPSKLVATKTRRGLPQNFEKIETIREMSRKSANDDESEFSVPKPVFQQRKSHNYMRSHHHQQTQEILSPQHEELARYMNESWKMVIADNPYDISSDSGSTCSSTSSTSSSSSYVYYVDQPSSLKDFKPFDLESWWGRRLYQNITKSL